MRSIIAVLIAVLLLGLSVGVFLFARAEAAQRDHHEARSAELRAALAERAVEADAARAGGSGGSPRGLAPAGSLEQQNEALRDEVESLRAEAAALLAEIEAAGGQVDETLEERLRRLALQKTDDGGR